MPMILITGMPCSGKSTIAKHCRDHFEERVNTTLVSDSDIGPVNDIYKDSTTERQVRGRLKSSVLRVLGKDTLVILDSSNYVKGFRYELYCAAREYRSTHCIIECSIDRETAWKRNQSRPEAERYHRDIFDSLIFRYEAPDPRNRWDSPYFLVQDINQLDLKAIEEALFMRKAAPPNQSTQSQPISESSVLFHLDSKTKDIIDHVAKMQKVTTGPIKVPGEQMEIKLNRKLAPAELHRIRRLFISYTRSHPINRIEEINPTFIQYLNSGRY